MWNRAWVWSMLSVAMLGGCQTVDDAKVVISPELNSQSTMYSLKSPEGFMVSAQQYQQQFGDFSVRQLQSTGTSSTTTPIERSFGEWSRDVANAAFLFLVFDVRDHYPGFDERNQRVSHSEFQFDLQQQAATTHVDCRVLAIATETVYERDGAGYAGASKSQRDQSTLGCRFTEQGVVSELIIDTGREKPARLRLRHGSTNITMTALNKVQMLVGGQWRTPAWPGPNAMYGTSFSIDGVEQAAVSMYGKTPKIWLANGLEPTRQRLLAAVAYTMILHSWSDATWLHEAAPGGTAGGAQSPVPWH